MREGAMFSGSSFPETRWSVVLRAQGPADAGARQEALSELCRIYWYPLYAFARRDGWPPEDAEDHTQSFFARFLETDLFARVAADRGRLRTFLLAAFRHDLADFRRSASRQKRGGAAILLPIDFSTAEGALNADTNLQLPAENAYDRRWALALLAATVDELEQEYRSAGRTAKFEGLRTLLGLEDPEGADWEAIGAPLGLSSAAVRQAAHRLRRRFRARLRQRVADTLVDPDERQVEEELAALRAALSS